MKKIFKKISNYYGYGTKKYYICKVDVRDIMRIVVQHNFEGFHN